MRICQCTTVHTREDVRVFHKTCVSLAASGFEVFLLVADGRGNEVKKNVSIIDIGDYSNSRVKRLLSARQKMLNKALELRADCYQLHDPELLPMGLKLKKRGMKVVYDSHEDVSKQILYKTWLGPLFFRKRISSLYDKYEKKTVSKFDGLISVVEEITNKFSCSKKITVKNFPLTDSIIKERAGIRKTKNLIVYVGSLTRERGIKDYIQAMEYIPENYKLLLIGRFNSNTFYEECRALNTWNRVEFIGFQPIEEVNKYLVRSFLGLSVLHVEKNYLTSLPTKGFEYMAAGIPMIMSDFEYWKPYFETCAIMINPGDPVLIGKSVNRLIDDKDLYSEFKQECIELSNKYSWSNEIVKLIRLFKSLQS